MSEKYHPHASPSTSRWTHNLPVLPGEFDWPKAGEFEVAIGAVDAACTYLQGLSVEGKVKAVEYIWRAPDFIATPLRQRLQQEPWFQTSK